MMAPALAMLSLMFFTWIIAFASSFTEESDMGDEPSSKGQSMHGEKAA